LVVKAKAIRTEGDNKRVAELPSDPQGANAAPEGPTPFEPSRAVKKRCEDLFSEMMEWIEYQAAAKPCGSLAEAETGVVARVFQLGRMLLLLFLTCAEEHVAAGLLPVLMERGRPYERNPRKPRRLGTFFGKVWYWRTYMYSGPRGRRKRGRGFFPLDRVLGLARDGFSWQTINLALRMAVEMPYERAAFTLSLFLRWSPATRTIEELVLGAGSYAREFQAAAPAPPEDGEVLVVQFDSKGVPTATDVELKKRRGKRPANEKPKSQRHRGRAKRKALGPKKRRRPGDKSKNARMGTLVVMYTLRRETGPDGQMMLVGPLNKRVFASFAPKKYAFEVARREAIKRGFGPTSGKTIQFVTDGDDDLDTYRKEYFADYPGRTIITTLDLPHVLEYLWSAGGVLHEEGSGELSKWVARQKKRLLDNRADLVLAELRTALDATPKTGPGNKGRRERLIKAIRYIDSNLDRMNYRNVIEQDLELASGAVEGAVKHVMGARFDQGGMRWIRERAEALLQLRCIAMNGQWDDFFAWLQPKMVDKSGEGARLRRRAPVPLPEVSRLQLHKAA
jgi:hypothetical protein